MKFTTKAGRMLSALVAAAVVVTSMPQTALTVRATEMEDTVTSPRAIVTEVESDISSDENADLETDGAVTSEEAAPIDLETSEETQDAETSEETLLVDTETPDESQSLWLLGEDDITSDQFQVSFELSGHGVDIDPLTVDADSLLEDTPDLQPTEEGFRFDGWYKDAELTEQWDFDTDTVTTDITLYAKWTALYTVTFVSEWGDAIDPLTVDADSKLDNKSDLQLTEEGFRFDGWYKDETFKQKWNFATDTVTKDITLYAKWTALYTVTFVSEQGDAVDPLTVDAGSKLDNTSDLQPTADGFHFEGWYQDAEFTQPWNFNKDTVTQNITLYAKWQEIAEGTCVVTFNLSGQGNDLFQYLDSGSKLEKPADPQPADEGCRFLGWYKESGYETEWDFEHDTVTADTTLYAKWEEGTCTVTFDLLGKGTNITKADIIFGSLLTQTEELTPTAEGYLFLGWYKDADYNEVWDFANDTVTDDIKLYARWQKVYTVTFNLSGKGADIVKSNIYEGGLIPRTDDLTPTADGCHFENWYKDPGFTQVWDFDNDTVTDDLTLYAKWRELEKGKCVVTYNLSGQGEDFYDYVELGSTLDEPKEPAAEGLMFIKWYTDEDYDTAWDFKYDTVDGDLTLYAKWKELTRLQVGAIAPRTFTGKAIKPSVSVYYSVVDEEGEELQTTLKVNKDYKVSYKNNINTNAYVLGKGESGEDGGTPAGGSNSTGEKGVGGFNPSLPYVLIEGKGNYSGKLYMNFEITQVSIGDEEGNLAAGITLKCNDQFPLGKPDKNQKTITSLKYKEILKEGTDYTAEISDVKADGSVISKDDPIFNKDGGGGECTLTITGIGNYTGTIVRKIIVANKNTLLKNAAISLGSKCKSKTLNEDGVELIPACYVEVEDEETGEPKTVYMQYIDDEWIERYEDYNEDGDPVYRKLDRDNAFTVKIGDKWLMYDEDYDISYANNMSVGTATMTITGKGDYIGSKSVNFKITKGSGGSGGGKAFNKDTINVTGWASKMTYTGSEQTQSGLKLKSTQNWHWEYEDEDDDDSPKHKVYDTFEEEEDYTVTYKNNVRVGTATATFTANPESGYSGSFKKTFKITPVNVAKYVTFEGSETLEPVTEGGNTDDEDDEDDEDTPSTTAKVSTTRYMEDTVSYVKSGATLDFSLVCDRLDETLVLNRDYTISYKNHKKVTPLKRVKIYDDDDEDDDDENTGKAWHYGYKVNRKKMGALVIKGKGNYSGTLTIKYQIVKGEMNTEEAVVTVARSAYNPKTKEYKPKVTVWTPNAGKLSPKEFTVKYKNNKKADVKKYLKDEGEAPTVTVSLKKNKNYTNLCDTKDEDGNVEKYKPVKLEPVVMEFYRNKLTAKNLYIIIDNENSKELVYTGQQVTNVKARVYYGSKEAVKAAKKAKVTNDRLLTDRSGSYKLVRLTEAVADEEGEYSEGEYTVTYGKNTAAGKNKGSIKINGCGKYGGSVSRKFTIYKNPVYYNVVPVE